MKTWNRTQGENRVLLSEIMKKKENLSTEHDENQPFELSSKENCSILNRFCDFWPSENFLFESSEWNLTNKIVNSFWFCLMKNDGSKKNKIDLILINIKSVRFCCSLCRNRFFLSLGAGRNLIDRSLNEPVEHPVVIKNEIKIDVDRTR